MLTKLQYLKLVLQTTNPKRLYGDKTWYLKTFAILTKDTTAISYLDVELKDGEMYYLDDSKELQKILDYKKGEPLFFFTQELDIDSSWFSGLSSKITTTIGRLIVNKLVLFDNIPGAFSYINDSISVDTIESLISSRVKNQEDVKSPKDISVQQMIKIIDDMNFLSNLAQIVNIATTYKVITPPPGIEKIKEQLIAEYKDQLNDPVKVVELENKLQAIDNDYLKDDVAAKNVFSKKSKNARKKMYLMFGNTLDFVKDSDSKPIVKSLTEKLDTSEENFPKYANDLRLASFSRGSFTQLSGYSYKILQRSLANIEIVPNECDTTRGVVRDIDKRNYSNLINRYVEDSGKWKLVESKDEASSYMGKKLKVRSMMYCTTPGNKVCYKCVSESYKSMPNGSTIIASQMSSVLMSMFLKLMHGGEIQTTEIKMTDLVC